MRFIFWFGLAFYYTPSALSGQQALVDSLLQRAEAHNDYQVRVKALLDLGYHYAGVDMEAALVHLRKADRVITPTDDLNQGRLYYQLAYAYKNATLYDSALYSGEAAVSHFRTLRDTMRWAGSLQVLSAIKQETRNYMEAARELTQALEMSEIIGDTLNVCYSLSNLGYVLLEQEDRLRAAGYFQKALGCYQSINEFYGEAKMKLELQNLIDDPALSRQYLDDALRLARRLQVPELLIQALNNKGGYFIRLYRNLPATSENQREKEALLDSAAIYLEECHQRSQQSSTVIQQAQILANLGCLYGYRNPLDGRPWFERAIDLAFENRFLSQVSRFSQLAMEVFQRSPATADLADRYAVQALAYRDSMYQDEVLALTRDLEERYQNQSLQQQLHENEMSLRNQQLQRRNLIYGGMGLLTVLGLLVVLITNRQRRRMLVAEHQRDLQAVETQNLQELSELRTRMFTNISHELRTPLTLILGPIRRFLRTSQQPDHAQLRAIEKQGVRLQELIDQLLDLRRIELGKQPLQLVEDDLVAFIIRQSQPFADLAGEKEITWKVDPMISVKVAFDADAISKVVNNLLSNAIKFTEPGGEVGISFATIDGKLTISIADSGMGIPPDSIDRIFERFYQVDDALTREYAGSGIGLALARDLVALQHGTLSVESKMGRGTTFHLSFPVIGDLAPQVSREVAVVASNEATERPIVLIAEDEDDMRDYIAEELSAEFDIRTASNGEEVLALIHDLVPDLILSDVMMPRLDGLELCRKVKADRLTCHIPVVLLTALNTSADRIKAYQEGADAWMNKPFQTEELLELLRNLIRQRTTLAEFFRKSPQVAQLADRLSPLDRQFLNDLSEAIDANLDDPSFGPKHLQDVVHFSKSHLHRKLKSLTGLSPSVFIRTIRLKHAHRLLSQQAGNVTEVAFMTGFTSPAYFSRCFHEQFGCAPSQVDGS